MQKKQVESKFNVDLIRLGLMGKNAIDVHSLKSVFLVQAVGINLTFYLLEKKLGDIYQMVEVDHLAFPQSLEGVPSLIRNLDGVNKTIDIFKRFWFHNDPANTKSSTDNCQITAFDRIVHTGSIK
ncbi:unnamed protein product [Mucor hiemalis]